MLLTLLLLLIIDIPKKLSNFLEKTVGYDAQGLEINKTHVNGCFSCIFPAYADPGDAMQCKHTHIGIN